MYKSDNAVQWKFLKDSAGDPDHRPYVTVGGFAYDYKGNFPIMYRSNKVRSAKNCWSLPTGLHEIGKTMPEQLCNELNEELNLTAIPTTARQVGTFENIAVCDGFHWVIVVFIIRVETLDTLKNLEPDKHTEVELCHVKSLLADPLLGRRWSPGLGEVLPTIGNKAARLIIDRLSLPQEMEV